MKFLLGIAYQMIRAAMNNASLWNWIESLVLDAEMLTLSGEDKKASVTEELNTANFANKINLATVSPWFVNLAIEAMVARIKVSK